jgi:hypothetical protein
MGPPGLDGPVDIIKYEAQEFCIKDVLQGSDEVTAGPDASGYTAMEVGDDDGIAGNATEYVSKDVSQHVAVDLAALEVLVKTGTETVKEAEIFGEMGLMECMAVVKLIVGDAESARPTKSDTRYHVAVYANELIDLRADADLLPHVSGVQAALSLMD